MECIKVSEIVLRLFISLVFSSVIGADREFKNRPAGIRTHVLVCLSATGLGLIQQQIVCQVIQYGLLHPDLSGFIRSDPARLISQVISGIGFLGAGTIVITKRSISGLTTAASIWAIAALGIAIGMGYYLIATLYFIFILIGLTLMYRYSHRRILKRVEIIYTDTEKMREFIQNVMSEYDVKIRNMDFNDSFFRKEEGVEHYSSRYTLAIPKDLDFLVIVEAIAKNDKIISVRNQKFD